MVNSAKTEQIENAYRTTLNGAINNSTTSVTVTDGSGYPADGYYLVTVEGEIMRVSSRSTNVLTVTRGVEGTTATGHGDGAGIVNMVATSQFENWVREFSSWDRLTCYNEDWDAYHRNLDGEVTQQTSSFTRDGPASGEVGDNASGSMFMDPGAIGILAMENMRKTAPSTPYTLTGRISLTDPSTNGAAGNYCGLQLRESSTNRWLAINMRCNATIEFATWASQGSLNSTIDTLDCYNRTELWFRLTNDGTTMEGFVSWNGYNWYSMGTETVGTYLTPDEVAWGGQSRDKPNHKFVCQAWLEH
jgi:hypothetical protein